jgi:hypothetical protein
MLSNRRCRNSGKRTPQCDRVAAFAGDRTAKCWRAPMAWFVVLLLVLAPDKSLYAGKPAPQAITLNDVIAAFEKREATAVTVELRWDVSVHYEAGAVTSVEAARQMQMRGKALESGIPAAPVTLSYPSVLTLKKGSMKFVRQTLRVDPMRATLSLIPRTSSFDASQSTTATGSTQNLSGSFLKRRRNPDVDLPGLLPLMLYYRPIGAPSATLDQKALSIVDKSTEIGGHPCVCVDDGRVRLYLDAERALVPVKFQVRRSDGGLFLDGLIEYTLHAVLALAPKHFEVKRYGRESSTNPVETIRGEITETKVGP